MEHGKVHKFLYNITLTLAAKPVYGNRGVIVALGKPTGGIGREFQYGRTAESPVGYKKWSFRFHLCADDAYRHILNNSSHQVQQRTLFKTEAEKRRYRTYDVQLQGAEH